MIPCLTVSLCPCLPFYQDPSLLKSLRPEHNAQSFHLNGDATPEQQQQQQQEQPQPQPQRSPNNLQQQPQQPQTYQHPNQQPQNGVDGKKKLIMDYLASQEESLSPHDIARTIESKGKIKLMEKYYHVIS